MNTINKHWIVWIDDQPSNVECVKLVLCRTEQEALAMGSKIFGIKEKLLDAYEKEPHIRKKRSKNANQIQSMINSYWLVSIADLEVWDADLIFCDTGENAIKSALYIHGMTSKVGAVSKQLTPYVYDIVDE